MESIIKDEGMVTYGENEVRYALEIGAVDILLISEKTIDHEIIETANRYNSKIEVFSTETEEGFALYKTWGGIAAILRFN